MDAEEVIPILVEAGCTDRRIRHSQPIADHRCERDRAWHGILGHAAVHQSKLVVQQPYVFVFQYMVIGERDDSIYIPFVGFPYMICFV